MKAVVFDQCGEPESVLAVRDVGEPNVGPGQVLVRMLASPVNPSDLMFVRGSYTLAAEPPTTPGFEGVGIVEQSGGGLRANLMKNRRVAVLSRKGGNWASHVAVPATQVIPLSSSLSDDQAATFFVNPATAWIMTQRVLKVPSGAWLLQTAAGSELGRMIIRLGSKLGFKTLNVVRREQQGEELKAAGATHVLVFDDQQHSPDNLVDQVTQVVGSQGAAFAIDPVGGVTGSAVVRCLDRDGHMLAYGSLSGEPLQFSPRDLMTPGARVEGFWLGNFMERQSLPSKLIIVRTITRLIREGVLGSRIGQTFALDDITAAVRNAETSGRDGKTLLRIGT